MAADSKLSKFFAQSEIREFRRSEIHPAEYNPRTIDAEGERALKRSLKKFGALGGIIINTRTGNTVVGGHQKIAIMDEYHKYDPENPESDYLLRAEAIDVDERTEKTINITLNNPNVGGVWDMDKMRVLIPDIDYKDAGLTEADLSMIGVDFLLQTEGENSLADELGDLNAPLREEAQRQAEQRRIERELAKEDSTPDTAPIPEPTYEDKIQHMKNVKEQVAQQAGETARNMDAYVVLSFSDWDSKAAFCEQFGFSPYEKFIKGEAFAQLLDGE